MEEEDKKTSQPLFIWGVLLVILAIGGYYLFTKVRDKESEQQSDMETVTLQLKWVEQAQFMGFLVANKLGIKLHKVDFS